MNRKTAEKVLAEIEAKYATILTDNSPYGKPTLRDYTHEELSRGAWSIDWEEGPYEWAYDYRTQVPGVFVEPVNTFTLGLYNA